MIAKVRYNKKINKTRFFMEIESKIFVKNAKPGQYLMVNVKNNREVFDPLLNRAFAVADIKEDSFFILYEIVGKGTELLSTFKKNDMIEISKPLGNGFTTDINNKHIAIVAGGIGIAPFLWLSKLLYTKKNHISLYYGGKSKDDIVLLKLLKPYVDRLVISTEDGTMGKNGLITDYISNGYVDFVYMCGPSAMMMKATTLFNDNIYIEVSMDEKMCCGIGLCMGCSIFYKQDDTVINKKCCKDGPIFDGRRVLWQI